MVRKILFLFIIFYFIYNPVIAQSYSKANSLFNKGTISYQEGYFADAIEFYNNAESIYLKLSKDQDLSAYTSLWRGIAYNSLFDYESAIIDLKKSIKKAMKQNYPDVVSTAYSYLADSYYSIDNWSDAYETWQSVLKYAQRFDQSEYFPAIYEGLGNVEFAWGKYNDAERYYTTALEYAEQQEVEESIIKINIGFGKIEHAKNNLQKSILIYEALLQRPGIENSLFYISIVNSLGTVYFNLGKIDIALEHYNNAMFFAEEQEDIIEIIRLHIHIGGAFHILGRYNDALDSYNKALLLTENYSREGDRSICLFNIGLAYVYLNKLEESIPFFEESIDIKEKLRLSATGKDRLDYLAAEVHVYQWLSSVYLQMVDYKQAIDIIERSSAMYLIEQLNYRQSESLVFPGTDIIQENLTDNEIIITFAGNSTPRHSLLTISGTALDGIFLFSEDLSSRFTDADLDNFNRLNILHGSSSLLSADKRISQINEFNFENIISYYRLLLISQGDLEQIHLIGRYLYDYFIAPIEDKIDNYNKLIIVPDGILSFLPFETLIMPDGRYLIEKFDISYIQSLAVSEIVKSRNYTPDRKDFIGFGGADYANFNIINSNYSFLNIKGWNNLPGTLVE
ncbi:MAG: hypothetical protein DRI73_10070, partial [Bacteroidetes bacterium]